MRYRLAVLALGAAATSAAAQGMLASRGDVHAHIADGKCDRAVRALEPRLQQGESAALLLAGWLSERGVCLERSAERAWAYYERAAAAGDKKVGLRLAGLAATVEGGQDVAAVLWWGRTVSQDEGGSAGGRCDPLPDQPGAGEAALVEVLRRWPQDRLEFCRALVGFQGLVNAELRYPTRALFLHREGEMDLSFRLHEGSFDIVPRGRGADPLLVERVRTIVQEALARLPRPRVPVEGQAGYVFRIE